VPRPSRIPLPKREEVVYYGVTIQPAHVILSEAKDLRDSSVATLPQNDSGVSSYIMGMKDIGKKIGGVFLKVATAGYSCSGECESCVSSHVIELRCEEGNQAENGK